MSTETKHTPAPWELQKYVNHIGFSIWGSGRGCIAERWDDSEQSPPYSEEILANARLIAAAPELLEALQAWVEWAENRDIPFGLISETRLVIAKATEDAQ